MLRLGRKWDREHQFDTTVTNRFYMLSAVLQLNGKLVQG